MSEPRVTEALRRLITSGRLRPGERVIESRIASRLGVSRTSLRESLQVLTQEGLLSAAPHQGLQVTALTAQDIYEIYTLRRALEEMAVRIGVPAADPERVARLRDAFALMVDNARRGDEESAVEDSHRLHLALVGLAGHQRLENAYRGLSLQLTMYLNRRARVATETLVERAERHRAIVDGVVAGDQDAVLAALSDGTAVTVTRRVGEPHRLTADARRWYAEHAPDGALPGATAADPSSA